MEISRKDKIIRNLKITGRVLFAAGCAWFLLPIIHGGFDLGAAFGLCVCLTGFALIHFYRRIAARGGWRKALVRLISVFFSLGMAWAVYLTVIMISAQFAEPPHNTNVIVLGSQVYSAERMGKALTNRVNAAYEYLLKNPQAKVIVTGGQGGDEPCAEAVAEKNALLRMGIDEDRIYVEDQSGNTRQNMQFSKEIAEENDLGDEFVIVTQGFHMYRAMRLAETAGFTPYSLIAETDPILFPEYFGRELLSLTKWHIQHLVLD